MDEREHRRQLRAIREIEIRTKLEREIKASNDFIFGNGPPPERGFATRNQPAGIGRRVVNLQDNHADARIFPTAAPRQVGQRANQGDQFVDENAIAYVACPKCFFPTLMSEMDGHISVCLQIENLDANIQLVEQDNDQGVVNDVIKLEAIASPAKSADDLSVLPGSTAMASAAGSAAHTAPRDLTADATGAPRSGSGGGGGGSACVVCWDERPDGARCPAGAHVICDDCLGGLVRSLAEQTPAQLGDHHVHSQ